MLNPPSGITEGPDGPIASETVWDPQSLPCLGAYCSHQLSTCTYNSRYYYLLLLGRLVGQLWIKTFTCTRKWHRLLAGCWSMLIPHSKKVPWQLHDPWSIHFEPGAVLKNDVYWNIVSWRFTLARTGSIITSDSSDLSISEYDLSMISISNQLHQLLSKPP